MAASALAYGSAERGSMMDSRSSSSPFAAAAEPAAAQPATAVASSTLPAAALAAAPLAAASVAAASVAAAAGPLCGKPQGSRTAVLWMLVWCSSASSGSAWRATQRGHAGPDRARISSLCALCSVG